MKTINQIKEEVANYRGFSSWAHLLCMYSQFGNDGVGMIDSLWQKATERFEAQFKEEAGL